MSLSYEFTEFACRLTLETGAPPHLLLPLARRLRRLATTHARRCVVACNGCRTCHGVGFVVPVLNSRMYLGRVEWVPMENESRTDRRPCPTCSVDAVEAAIEATCRDLRDLRNATPTAPAVGSGGLYFAPTFQHDPRGATVRLRVPSGASGSYGGVAVPLSARV